MSASASAILPELIRAKSSLAICLCCSVVMAGASLARRSAADRLEQRFDGVAGSEAQRPLDLRPARVTGGEYSTPALAGVARVGSAVDLLLPREVEDPERVRLVRDLVPVHAAHAAAPGLHDLERNAQRREDRSEEHTSELQS